jgi:tetratricopeptide (TPR) repeat protein
VSVATQTSALEPAREAASRYAWREAFDLFATADAVEPLGAADLNTMADCAWWIGKMRHCIALRERAHGEFLKAGDVRGAAGVAIKLADHRADLMEPSDAAAWMQRATRLLEDLPEGPEHGWLSFTQAMKGVSEGDGEAILRFSTEASEIGARHQDKDLFALSTALRGMALFHGPDPDEGLRMVEEVAVGAVNGELGPLATGWIYCMMISSFARLTDWQRAGQWTEAATNWCNRQSINGFPGVCRVHRAEIMRLRGSLFEAEEEARTAAVELGSFNLMFAAQAFRELGEVRLKLGDIDAAEEAFRQATEMGVAPQPGLALVQVQRGNVRGAAQSVRRALADVSLQPLDRGKLLPTQLEVALLLGDIETARTAAAELAEIAATHSTPALLATADAARAAVGLADGVLEPAVEAALRARTSYDGIELVYESARVALLLGEIYLAQGDPEAAEVEVEAALAVFNEIGAVPDADRARRIQATLVPAQRG